MKRIGLLSDTHGYWDKRYLKYFENCDEIWHAGDIGSLEVAERLADFRPLRAVYGNIDGQDFFVLIIQFNYLQVREISVFYVESYKCAYPMKTIFSGSSRVDIE